MSKKPNKMGRIEADPKPKKKLYLKELGVVLLTVMLVATGVMGTLRYQKFIEDTKAQGVSEFKEQKCNPFKDEEQKWLECEVKRDEQS